jgi:ABC-2 type transport system permease protein
VSAGRILAIARRIAQGFRRDERTLGLMFVVPLVVTALLGWVMRDTKDTLADVVVVNEAGLVGDRIASALVAASEDATTGIRVVANVGTRAEGEDRLRSDGGDLAIVIPSTLLADVLAGNRPTFTVITKGTEPAADASAFSKLQGVMATLARDLVPPGGTAPVIPQIQHETVYLTPDADQVDVLAPIFLGFFGYFFVFILTGISFLRERIGGTLERLVATPRDPRRDRARLQPWVRDVRHDPDRVPDPVHPQRDRGTGDRSHPGVLDRAWR